MDSISQASLGGAIGEVVLGKKIGNKGIILGAAIATIPDLDVVFYLFYDSFDMLRIHRGFSHSILFTFIGATLISWLLTRVSWTKNINFFRLWLFSWLCLFTHIILDVFTAYGTQIYLPFSDQRVGLDSINVVDPVYTIPLLGGILLSAFFVKNAQMRSMPTKMGLLLSTTYLLATLGIKSNVHEIFKGQVEENKIEYEKIMTMPVGVANINWYGVATTKDSLYLQKYSVFHGLDDTVNVFAVNDALLDNLGLELSETMRWFSKGYYCVQGDVNRMQIYNLQVDMRGVTMANGEKVPTKGFFEMTKSDNGYIMSSGSH